MSRVPLTFPDAAAFRSFCGELAAAFAAESITDSTVLQYGRAANGWEVNPALPLEAWTPDSPMELAIFSAQALMQAMRANLTVDRSLQYQGRYVSLQGLSQTPLGARLQRLGAQWQPKLPGRPEVRFRLCLAAEPFFDGPFVNAIVVLSPAADLRLEQLDAAATLRFKRALVEHAIALLEPHLPPEQVDIGQRGGTRMAREWLHRPTDENADRARTYVAADCFDGGVRNHDYSEVFHGPAEIAGAKTAEQAARALLEVVDRLKLPSAAAADFLRRAAQAAHDSAQ